MFRINWKTETGLTGNGSYIYTIEVANSWIKYLETKYPDMQHWIEVDPKQD